MEFSPDFPSSDWLSRRLPCSPGLGPSFCVLGLKIFDLFAICAKIMIFLLILQYLPICGFHWHSRYSTGYLGGFVCFSDAVYGLQGVPVTRSYVFSLFGFSLSFYHLISTVQHTIRLLLLIFGHICHF